MPKKQKIFAFWEPKNKIPPYLKLCVATWKKFLPEYEVNILDYKGVDNLLGENFFDKHLYKKFSLPMQADCIRCALLEKYGGIWFDLDTIISSENFKKFLDIKSQCIMTGHHIGFIIAEPHAQILKNWLNGIQKNIQISKKYSRFGFLLKFFNKKLYKSIKGWDFLGNKILNPLFEKADQKIFYSIDRIKLNTVPEAKMFTNNPFKAYRDFYFNNDFSEDILRETKGLISLHNSWTPEEFKQMSIEEFLSQKNTLSSVFKNLLTEEEIKNATNIF